LPWAQLQKQVKKSLHALVRHPPLQLLSRQLQQPPLRLLELHDGPVYGKMPVLSLLALLPLLLLPQARRVASEVATASQVPRFFMAEP
jgi:hypothetical protein